MGSSHTKLVGTITSQNTPTLGIVATYTVEPTIVHPIRYQPFFAQGLIQMNQRNLDLDF